LDFKGIDVKTFYKVGLVCFSVVVICQIGNFIYSISRLTIFSIIQNIASIIFTFALIAFFYWLLNQQKDTLPPSSAEDIEEAFNEANRKRAS